MDVITDLTMSIFLISPPCKMNASPSDLSGCSSYLSVTMRNIIKTSMTGDDSIREQVKPWRKRLREICNEGGTSLLESIGSDKLDMVDKYKEFVQDKADVAVEEEEGSDEFAEIRLKNKQVLDEYLLCLEQMFQSYNKIEQKLSELEELEHEFIALSCLDEDDGTKEFSTLHSAIQEFIQKRYEKSTVAEDYMNFQKNYKRWKVLRGVVLQAHVAQDMLGGPYCSICTTEKVNTVLNPCGHTYCNNCGQKQKSACFICRSAVKERLRIFFT